MVGKSDFNENPVVSLDLDFDLGFVNGFISITSENYNLNHISINQAEIRITKPIFMLHDSSQEMIVLHRIF